MPRPLSFHRETRLRYRLLLWLLIFIVGNSTDAFPVELHSTTPKIVVIASKAIKPYVEAVDGLTQVIEKNIHATVATFYLDHFESPSYSDLVRQFPENPDMIIAIGPEAADYAWRQQPQESAERVYSIILNPEKVIPDPDACGVPLNIPIETQVRMIQRGFPLFKDIGLIYDPDNNAAFFDMAAACAADLGFRIIPLEVSSRYAIADLVDNVMKSQDIDALWLIPDHTVISESIVRYITKNALLYEVPVIGYNKFFYESGATMAFVFDYGRLGRQTGHLALSILEDGYCSDREPEFFVWINTTLFKTIQIPEDFPEEANFVIDP